MNRAVLGLLPAEAHVVLEVGLVLDQVKLADELDEVIAAESLSVLLAALVLVHVVNVHAIFPYLVAAVLAKDVKLDELEAVVAHLTSEHQSVVWVHAGGGLVVLGLELRVEVEDLLEPHVLVVFMVNLRIQADRNVLVHRHSNLDLLSEASKRCKPVYTIVRCVLRLAEDDLEELCQAQLI